MSIAAHHAEWLSLIDVSGPFLSVPVLRQVFPNGLPTHDATIAAELRAAYDAWSDPDEAGYDPEEIHGAFVRFVLHRVLDFRDDDIVAEEEALKDLTTRATTHPVDLVPTMAVMNGAEPRMLVSVSDRSVQVDQPLPGDAWTASPRERMVEMLAGTGCPLGLITDGERWTVVSRREGEAPGYATWWASLWREERITLRAFRALLGAHQFFSVPAEETLVGLLERSAEDQSEVTTKLGNQTLEAVEILIRTIDHLDRDRGGQLLAEVPESELYDAAVTVMMRLIFLFFAEENDLLPMEEPLYVEEYAASSLRARLQEAADQFGEEVLETSSNAWPRLLSTWRAVFAGVEHGDMRLSPYGGSLFDPDRYPFLEGRLGETSWRDEPADPLPIDNRTVLHLLNALQTLAEGGQRRRLSFRALDVEQIGHVYEGMLDHTAARAEDWVLGLSGTGGKEPEIALDELEALDDDALVDLLKDRTGRNAGTIRSWLDQDPAEEIQRRFANTWRPAFRGEAEGAERARPFAKFIREDSKGAPTVFQPDSVYVCDSSHRGATGTHYTPRSFTEEIVAETLDPLVYDGIAEGKPEESWSLRTPDEILALRVADPACGSGAFLVQVCRHLSEKLVESRRLHGALARDPTEEDLVGARREIAGRCLYGVDKNPMAVEMAKLSLWLVSLAKDKPFSFVDHALRVGDSLVGITDPEQLRHWSLTGVGDGHSLFAGLIADEYDTALDLRREIESYPVLDSTDANRKLLLLRQAEESTERVRMLADLLVAPAFAFDNPAEVARARHEGLLLATSNFDQPMVLRDAAQAMLGAVQPFHWVLEFPEVFLDGGFDGIVGNPPFLGGQRITGTLGTRYREYLVRHIAGGARGSADLVAYFFLRAAELCRESGGVTLIATNSIAQGNTREIALDRLLAEGWLIRAATRSRLWPGSANVRISVVALRRRWSGPCHLDGEGVHGIQPRLVPRSRVSGNPLRLRQNANLSSQGSIVLGQGFVLSEDDARKLIAMRPENATVLAPYLNGRDLNTSPTQSATRWVINFYDWSESEAREYPEVFEVVERLVKPERLEKSYSRRARELWWQYERPRSELYHAIGRGHSFREHPPGWEATSGPMDRVLVVAQVSSTLAFALVPNDQIFDAKLIVFAYDDIGHFGVLSSVFHSSWCWRYGTTMKSDLSYGPTQLFETFPQPTISPEISRASLDLSEHRGAMMLGRAEGLTATYRRFNDRSEVASDVVALRALHQSLDAAVADAYGWRDLDVSRVYQETERGEVLRVPHSVSTELLDRLLETNLARTANSSAEIKGHAEERD